MNEFRIRKTGIVINEAVFRASRDEVFPAVLTPELADAFGMDILMPSSPPDTGPDQIAHKNGLIQGADGFWRYDWTIQQRDPDEVAAEQAKAKEANANEINAYLVAVRDLRERILNRLAGIAAAALATGNTTTLASFVAARQALLNITKAPGVAEAVDAEETKAAIKAEYIRIVLASPVDLRSAFDEVDA